MEIGAKIKSIRLAKGLSIRSFARIVNLSYGYIAKLEKSNTDYGGTTINPSLDVLKQICDRSHYDFALFLEETGYINSSIERAKLAHEDKELLEIIKSLSPTEKITLINMVKGLQQMKIANADLA